MSLELEADLGSRTGSRRHARWGLKCQLNNGADNELRNELIIMVIIVVAIRIRPEHGLAALSIARLLLFPLWLPLSMAGWLAHKSASSPPIELPPHAAHAGNGPCRESGQRESGHINRLMIMVIIMIIINISYD